MLQETAKRGKERRRRRRREKDQEEEEEAEEEKENEEEEEVKGKGEDSRKGEKMRREASKEKRVNMLTSNHVSLLPQSGSGEKLVKIASYTVLGWGSS